MKICYRFQIFPQKELFYEHPDLYDEIIVNSYTFEFYEDAVTLFLLKVNKPYIIDPSTFIFNTYPHILENKNGETKKHFMKLAKKYGAPVDSIMGERRIDSNDLNSLSELDINKFCERVIDYQLSKLAKKIGKIKKYVDLFRKLDNQGKITKKDSQFLVKFEGVIDQFEGDNIPQPERLIPPYFLAEHPNDPLYNLSLRLSKICTDYKNEIDLFPVIFLTKEFLRKEEYIEKLIDDYDWDGFDGYYIWINNFDESSASLDDLRNLKDFIKLFSERTSKPIINFYGEYFSVLLYHFGMTGLVSGICMSSTKDIFKQPQRPADKYYLNYAHYKAIIEEAERIHNNYIDLTCDCPVCRKGVADARRLLSRSFFLSNESKSEAIFISNMKARDRDIHFMYSRKEEANLIIDKSLEASIRELNNIIRLSNEKMDYLLNRDLLRKWIEAL